MAPNDSCLKNGRRLPVALLGVIKSSSSRSETESRAIESTEKRGLILEYSGGFRGIRTMIADELGCSFYTDAPKIHIKCDCVGVIGAVSEVQ